MILSTLIRKPMTSIETFEALKKAGITPTSGAVYQALRIMFTKGLLAKTENDEGCVAWKVK